jgi:hypothetical protein
MKSGFGNKTIALGQKGPAAMPPTTGIRRGMGTAVVGGGGSARPMTAVSGAGFNSNKSSVAPGIDNTVVLEPKVETYELKYIKK